MYSSIYSGEAAGRCQCSANPTALALLFCCRPARASAPRQAVQMDVNSSRSHDTVLIIKSLLNVREEIQAHGKWRAAQSDVSLESSNTLGLSYLKLHLSDKECEKGRTFTSACLRRSRRSSEIC